MLFLFQLMVHRITVDGVDFVPAAAPRQGGGDLESRSLSMLHTLRSFRIELAPQVCINYNDYFFV